MSENDVQNMLAAYVANGSNEAFQRLVQQFGGLVYATARRQLNGDEHLAQDAMQQVFADLARKAAKLKREGNLGGWLHCHTCFVCSAIRRSDSRRRARESAASELAGAGAGEPAHWPDAEARLDDAINDLKEPDRIAIIARFFERAPLRAVGELFGTSEDATQKRVARAVDRLREKLGQRGVAIPAAALAAGLNSATADLPSGLIERTSAGIKVGSGTSLLSGLWSQLSPVPGAVVATMAAVLATVGWLKFTGEANTEAARPIDPEATVESVSRSGTAAIGKPRRTTMAASSQSTNAAGIGTIHFIHAETREPIPEMTFDYRKRIEGVYKLGIAGKADEEGRWTIPNQPDHVRGIRIWTQKEGLGSSSISWNFDKGFRPPTNFVYPVHPAQLISGRVLDKDSNPMVEAWISLSGSITDLESFAEYEGKIHQERSGGWLFTDTNGFWSVDGLAAHELPTTTVSISMNGYRDAKIDAAKDDVRQQLIAGTHVTRLARTFKIRGRIIDENGAPIHSARVNVGHPYRDREFVESDFDGRFELMAPAAGVNILSAFRDRTDQYPDRVQFAANSVAIDSGNAEHVEIVLNRGRYVQLQVMNAAGDPMSGVDVSHDYWRPYFHEPDVGAKIVPTTMFNEKTDANGRVVWENAPLTRMKLRVEAKGHDIRYFQLEEGQTELRMKLTPKLKISGVVTDVHTGEPIPKFTIRAGWIMSGRKHPYWNVGDMFLPAETNGHFEMYVARSKGTQKKRLRLEADGYETFISDAFSKQGEDFELDVQLIPGKPRSISAITPSGDFASSADVALLSDWEREMRLDNRDLESSGLFLQGRLKEADNKGVFELPPGNDIQHVAISHLSGFAIKSAISLKSGDRIWLQPWGRIEGVVEGIKQSEKTRYMELRVLQDNWSTLVRTKIDSSNHFVIPFAPPGTFHLCLKTKDQPFQSVTVIPGSTNQVSYLAKP